MAVVCSLVSIATGIELKHNGFGMTGGMSLSGKVLGVVGGLEAKLQHAFEEQYWKVVVPGVNHDEAKRLIEANQWEGLELIPVDTIQELVVRVFLKDDDNQRGGS